MTAEPDVERFIESWKQTGGSELANTQSFINGLCGLIGVAPPDGSREDDTHNNYVFEKRVWQNNGDGTESFGRIDAYKRDCFVLEAKQGSDKDAKAQAAGHLDLDLFGQSAAQRLKRGTAKRGTPGWSTAMLKAKGQAERYAKALPVDHGWPPFLLVTDVGYCIEVFADFTGTGKAYAQFPDRASYRIMMEDLRRPEVRERLKAIWENPKSLNPTAISAEVTQKVAKLLAELAKQLEARGHNADRVAAFLSRALFTMFAEDTGLIPEGSFTKLLMESRAKPENLHHQLSALWEAMDTGKFSPALGIVVRRFNGYLFKDHTAIELTPDELTILINASKSRWTDVEPAIFGTLLERALNPKERARLGAHYTPRAYVERLVMPTVIEPLRADWNGVRAAAAQLVEAGDEMAARRTVEAFHTKLAGTKVLDPACGTGNFLYVSLARMKELEGEVLELLDELGDGQYLAQISGRTITPENFLGIEVNERAAHIAQLVLWIGYLQWHFRVAGKDTEGKPIMPKEPILSAVRTIEHCDALFQWDKRELERDASGKPVTRWDGETMKTHPVTGKKVPDETARLEVYRYVNPRPAKWPKADFIVGNPPFIGAKYLRDRLGNGYFEALFKTATVPESADYVMHWWNKAAEIVRKGVARTFGFITTNSLPQTFSRRVVARHLDARPPLSLVFAIPNHPWVDETDGADVRIAMTVGQKGNLDGMLQIVRDERHAPDIEFSEVSGRIHSDLKIGADVASASPLKANEGLASPGVKLHGDGFIVTREEAKKLGLGHQPGMDKVIRNYRNGRDLTARPREVMVIDLFGLSEQEVRSRLPTLWQHVATTVKPHRDTNNRSSYREKWWIYGEPRTELRNALTGLGRYVATAVTTKHRVFQFLHASILPDDALICFAFKDAYWLGLLSSRQHVVWSLAAGARMGVGDDPRYNKSLCFDPFPSPAEVPEPRKNCIRDEAEALDALRKKVLAEHDDLTLTGLYNVLEALRAGRALTPKERDIHDRGLVSLIKQHHDSIDALVAEAYGWPADLSDEEILTRLVALNKERAAEEARGLIRWLRPEFQNPGAVTKPVEQKLDLGEPPAPEPSKIIPWPKSLPEQVTAVAGILASASQPLDVRAVARAFGTKRAQSVKPVLDALAAIGQARRLEDGRYAA